MVTGVGTDDVLAVDSGGGPGALRRMLRRVSHLCGSGREYFSLTDMPLRSTAGCTMAPMRELAVWMGYYDFSYDAATGTAVCKNGTQAITVRWAAPRGAGARARPGLHGGAAPELVGWKLYVPVRFMVDAAGLEDVWDAEENTSGLPPRTDVKRASLRRRPLFNPEVRRRTLQRRRRGRPLR